MVAAVAVVVARASVWGSTRVLGVSPKGSVGAGRCVLGVFERAERWTALLFIRTAKPKELQQLRELSAPKCFRHRRFCEMALPIICLSACVLPSCYKGPLCLPF